MIQTITLKNFKFKHSHSAQAAVVMCMDFRFSKQTLKILKDKFNIDHPDIITLPGSTQGLALADFRGQTLISALTIACQLHHIRQLFLIHHADCGAYGGLKKFNNNPLLEKKAQTKDLEKSQAIIKHKFPELKVKGIFVGLDKKFIYTPLPK